MNYEVEPIVIDTKGMAFPWTLDTPLEVRAANYQQYDRADTPKCSIVVIGYQRFEKTKYCVECILTYTQDVDFELILVDGGLNDGTYEFFQSVAYPNKKIIQITQNLGMNFLWPVLRRTFNGKYLVVVSNDLYVTKNWLSNLLTCYESDPRIGLVEPVCTNVSNLQEVNLTFSTFEEMQEQAAENNISDPAKWEERIRLVSPIVLFSRPILDTVGMFDPIFIHDYADDDFSARMRRAGYKLILCRDTWICHDHDYGSVGAKDPLAYRRSLAYGAEVFRQKYHGIDPGDDFNNFEINLLFSLDTAQLNPGDLSTLTVDVRCGTPMLEIRNRLQMRKRVCHDSRAFTTQAKYFLDLQTVCDDVRCDRIEYLHTYYAQSSFDIIALGEPINTYPEPLALLQTLYNLLKPGGVLLFKLLNTEDYNAFLRASNLGGHEDPAMPVPLSRDKTVERLKEFGALDISFVYELAPLNPSDKEQVFSLLQRVKPDAEVWEFTRLIIKYYYFKIIK